MGAEEPTEQSITVTQDKANNREKRGEIVGFQFKPKLSAVLAVLNGVSVGLAYIASKGNITATIIWFAITTGATAGLSYYKEKE
ncbi:MAG: hypothetical protein AOA66_0294 [Candidatus Bathyarchaeota archaeon BA2]|nr:MAG: hypothetical protein AOA66_0294 [Candidatus Bathyarchaeota archaeon BA2]